MLYSVKFTLRGSYHNLAILLKKGGRVLMSWLVCPTAEPTHLAQCFQIRGSVNVRFSERLLDSVKVGQYCRGKTTAGLT